ncbi:MAG: hypothetical protein E7314_06295 [Clostridiales bacterium]|nr:hypothetical protein [Clostridiales bacterium]
MKNLKNASEVYKLVQQLKKKVDFESLPLDEEIAVDNALEKLEQIFEPYDAKYRFAKEEEKRRKEAIKKLCAEEGHVGEWTEEKYPEWVNMGDLGDTQHVQIEKVRWKRKCTRCGKEEVTEVEPKEVTRAKKEKEIKELEEKLKKMKEEL